MWSISENKRKVIKSTKHNEWLWNVFYKLKSACEKRLFKIINTKVSKNPRKMFLIDYKFIMAVTINLTKFWLYHICAMRNVGCILIKLIFRQMRLESSFIWYLKRVYFQEHLSSKTFTSYAYVENSSLLTKLQRKLIKCTPANSALGLEPFKNSWVYEFTTEIQTNLCKYS